MDDVLRILEGIDGPGKNETRSRDSSGVNVCHTDGAETNLLKSKLQAMTVNVYPKLVESLVTQTLRTPFDPNFEIHRSIERLLQEVTDHAQSNASLNSVKDTLLELKAMIARTSEPRDLPPIYFQLWTKYLEGSKELSGIEKIRARSQRASGT